MLLMKLETPAKFAFLRIAHHAAKADGKIGIKEKLKLEDCCIEMGIDNILFEDKSYDIDECLSQFKTPKSQKILLLELMILIHIDDIFNQSEQDLIEYVSKKFNMSKMQVKYASIWGKAGSALREQALLMIDNS